jgi:hypothetical protein
MPNAAYRRPWHGVASVVRVIQKAEYAATFRLAWVLAGSSRIPLRFIRATVAAARSYKQPITSIKVHPLCAGWIRILAGAMVGSSRIPLRFIQATLAQLMLPWAFDQAQFFEPNGHCRIRDAKLFSYRVESNTIIVFCACKNSC